MFYQRVTGAKKMYFLGPKHKSAIYDRTPPTYTSNLVYICAEGFRGHKSSNRIELSWFFKDLLYFFWFCFPWFLGVGQVGGGYLGWPTIVYMSSGVFRGKESSNRIKLSQLVQDLLNFGVLASLWLLGRGQMIGVHLGAWGCLQTCAHAHTCMHIHTCTCIEIANDHPHGGIHVYHV